MFRNASLFEYGFRDFDRPPRGYRRSAHMRSKYPQELWKLYRGKDRRFRTSWDPKEKKRVIRMRYGNYGYLPKNICNPPAFFAYIHARRKSGVGPRSAAEMIRSGLWRGLPPQIQSCDDDDGHCHHPPPESAVVERPADPGAAPVRDANAAPTSTEEGASYWWRLAAAAVAGAGAYGAKRYVRHLRRPRGRLLFSYKYTGEDLWDCRPADDAGLAAYLSK